jgi:hypothetical protein
VDEDVLATLALDEPITLLVREPLDGAHFGQLKSLLPLRSQQRGRE